MRVLLGVLARDALEYASRIATLGDNYPYAVSVTLDVHSQERSGLHEGHLLGMLPEPGFSGDKLTLLRTGERPGPCCCPERLEMHVS